MTAQEIYSKGIEKLPALERLRLATLILERLREAREDEAALDEMWAERIRRASIPNDELIRLAEKQPPPESWWNETDDPFAPETKEG